MDLDRSDAPLSIKGVWSWACRSMASPADIEENMIEARGCLPRPKTALDGGCFPIQLQRGDLVWSQYDAILNGYADQLAIPPAPNVIFSEDSTNIGLFGSVNYDLAAGTTLSFEGRFQTEDLTNIANDR